ncbi:unnamed protein product [Mytilus coruscus]|uniref:B box-type domain-containing protein n=1 Tax=Mytilus coruscus TaxID=42192 RepID=A0A6J8EA24_MYTCO|nr:unnamed protein product [Mytilus coruscus]
MATASKSCGVCELRHITTPSLIWCTECDEGLCTECSEHHSLSKSSRSHRVIPIVEYQKLPAEILKYTQYCTKHDKKYQFYCQKHECPCCSKGIVENHKECHDIVELDDIIHNAKTSNALCEIEETLVEVAENLQKIRQHQQDNLTTFKEKRKEIEKEIMKTRIKINNHLDKLQEDLMKQLYAVEEKENLKMCQLLSSLEKKEKEIADCQRNIMNIKQHGTDLQIFLSMQQIEEDVHSKDKFLQSLVEGENLKQQSLSYKKNTSLHNIMSDFVSFGEVHTEAKSCDIVLIKKKVKQAQMMVPTVQSRSIENIKLITHKLINTERKCIYGCCILPDGRLAFAYYSDCKVIVFNINGLKDFEVNMPSYAHDVVYIGRDNTLAVTSGNADKKLITIIDVDRKQIRKTVLLDSNCFGIALKDNRLIYSAADKGIRMINLHDESTCVIVGDKMQQFSYIATYRDNIYQTNTTRSTVTCHNLQDKLQWTFLNESVLRNPYGIAVDNGGNVYVAGFGSANVVVISPDGQQYREVLTASDGLKDPVPLHYSESKNQLLVANLSGKAHLFNFV